MNIALVSPDASSLKHRVRGTGSYFENLKKALLLYDKENEYSFPSGKKDIRNADLVHYPYFEPFFLSIPFTQKQRLVITVHDLTPLVFPNQFKKGLRGKIKWEIQKKLLSRADAIITDSNSSKKDIINFAKVDSSKIHVIYLAAGEEFKQIQTDLVEKMKKKYDLPEKFVLYVGDVTWNKNLPNLIKAVEKTGFALVMVGKTLIDKNFDKSNPWNKDLVEVQSMISNNKKIKVLGYVSTDDLVALYNAAQVFVMPSIYEGFGLPVLEAMSCGCPVVTSKKGSLPEVAGDAAIYVNPDSIDEIAEEVGKLLKNDELRGKLSNKGLEQAKKFSWEKTARETVDVYKKVLE